jgi:branched-chain amino acid transport system substrate-binding protein
MKRLLALLLCLAAGPAFAADTIKIALTGPYSGGSAPMGISTRDGSKLAIAEINAAGGIQVGAKKLKIEFIERDDEAKNERGALIAQELAAMPDLSGVIGSVNTGVVMAGDKHLQEKGITKIICPAAGSASMTQWIDKPAKDDKPAQPGPKQLSIFRFAAHDAVQADLVVAEAIARGLTKVAIFHDDTNYGVSGRDDMLAQIKKQGDKLTVLTQEKFKIGDKDMTAQLLKAKNMGAQAILIWAIGPEEAAVSNGMAKLGMKIPLIGGWTLSMSNYIDSAGANGNGTLMPQTFIEEPISPRAKAFIEAYHKAYGVTRIPSAVAAAQGYDAVLIFAAAVKQAGTTDSLKIRDALEDLKEPVDGVIALWKKPYSKWSPTDVTTHEAFRREQTVMGMVKDGRVVFANEADRARLAKRGAK